ncbi:MAG: hypothetical protein KKD56_10325 [Acidobacteria bacterium]|nr:hypothetical protein [Acidobacteriota bacterium]MBU1473301.1 hypothetical protein [Acidobacteriota bacterium]
MKQKTIKNFHKFVFILMLVPAILVPPLSAAPLWKHVLHKDLQLFGGIVEADEFGTYWDRELPEGWMLTTRAEKPSKYHIDLGQLSVRKEGGGIVFEMSRWNFVNRNLQDGFSESFIVAKMTAIDRLPSLRFREERELGEKRAAFLQYSAQEAAGAFGEIRRTVDFGVSSKGAVVLTTSRGQTWKIYIENFAGSGYLFAQPVDETGPSSSKKQTYVKDLENSWRTDLDGDGRIDIVWNHISHIRSSNFSVLQGQKIAVIAIYEK